VSWFTERIKEGIWGFLSDLASDMLTNAFELIVETILKLNNLNTYIDVYSYLFYIKILASGLFVVFVAYELFKIQAGGMIPHEEKSIGSLILQITWSGALIFFLPWVMENVIIRLNNIAIRVITSMGVAIDVDTFRTAFGEYDIEALGGTVILMYLILGLAFLVMGIIGGIRYFELIIAFLFAPIVGARFINKPDAIGVWARETISITFTQTLHVFLLQILLNVLGRVPGPLKIVLAIAVIVVMIKGANVLRQFTYSTGVGSSTVSAMGQVTRYQAMKYIFAK